MWPGDHAVVYEISCKSVRCRSRSCVCGQSATNGIYIAILHLSRTKKSQMQRAKRIPDPDIAPLGLIHLRYIEMFQAILQMGTLTDAACLLNISQPAATKLLKQAERRLGFPLFVRVKGQWHLTPESQMLKAIALREADIGFTLQELNHPDVRCEPLCQGPLSLIAPLGTWSRGEASK